MPAPTRGSDIEVTLKARNDAGATMEQFVGDLQKSRAAMRDFGRQMEALIPGASRVTAMIASASNAFKNLDLSVRVAALGLVAGAAGFIAYTRALDEAINKSVQFGQVTRSWDLGRIRGEMESARTEIARMSELRNRGPRGEEGAWYSPASWASHMLFVKDYWAEEYSNILFGTPRATERVSLLQPQAQTLVGIQQARARLELQGGMRQQEQARALALQQQQASFSSIGGYTAYGGMIETAAAAARNVEIEKAESDAKIAITARPEAAVEINKTLARQRALIHSTWETGTASRGIAARAFRQGIFGQIYTTRMAASGEAEPGQGFEQVSAGMAASTPAELYYARGKVEDVRAAAFAEDYARSFKPGEIEGQAEAVGVGPSVEEQARGMRRYLSDLIEARDIERERGSIAASFIGFTRDEAELMARQRIELEKRAEIERALKDERKIDLAEQRAAMDTLNLDITRGRRVDPITGLLYGVQQLEEELSSAGTRMQEVVRNTAAGMQRTFSELFFNIVVGDFKKLPDVGRQFGQAMIRVLTDELAKSAISPLVSVVRQALGTGSLAAGAAGVVGSGAVLAAPGYAGATVAPGAGGYLTTGGSAYGAFFQRPISSFFQSNADPNAAALGELGINTSLATAQRNAELGELGINTDLGGGGGGISLGQGLGIAASSVAFLASTYAAYKTGNVWGGAIGGGLSGLSIGSNFGPYGAVIGLVAGAAIGAGAGVLGKNANKAPKVRASVRSAQQAVASGTAFQQALSQAATTDDLLRVLNTRWSPYRELPIWAKRSDGSVAYPLEWIGDATGGGPSTHGDPGWGPQGTGLFTYEDLFDPAVLASIEVQQGQSGAAARNEQLTQMVKDKIVEIAGREGALRFGYSESFTAAGAPAGAGGAAFTRETFLPISRLKEAAGQQGVFYSSGALKAAGLDDNAIEALINRIKEVTGDRDLALVPVERFA